MKRAFIVVAMLVLLLLPMTAMGQSVRGEVNAVLNTLADEATDPWVRAIYLAGASDAEADGDAYAFKLRSYDPGLSELGDYDEDPAAWREAMYARVAAYALDASLEFDGDEPTSASLKALKQVVSKAASAAKTAFDDKRMRVAIADYLLPKPVESAKEAADILAITDAFTAACEVYLPITGSLTPEQAAPLYYAQTKQSLSVKDGPHALTLTCTGIPDAYKFIDGARQSVFQALSRQEKANQMDEEELEQALLTAACERSLAAAKKTDTRFTIVVDIDDLAGGYLPDDYIDYVYAYDYGGALSQLIDEVHSLPDYPAIDYPKTGRISGGGSGTKVIVKAPDDGRGRLVQVRDEEEDEVKATMFIRPGGSATVYVPRGMHYFLVASGETWFGEEHLFGDLGVYSRTEPIEIMSSRYYHTITLQASEDANMASYGADPSDFQ